MWELTGDNGRITISLNFRRNDVERLVRSLEFDPENLECAETKMSIGIETRACSSFGLLFDEQRTILFGQSDLSRIYSVRRLKRIFTEAPLKRIAEVDNERRTLGRR